jgi:hypothetical protein
MSNRSSLQRTSSRRSAHAGRAWIELERRLSDAAARLPGAIAASPAATVPFGDSGIPVVHGRAKTQEVSALGNFILQSGSLDYFRTVGTRIIRGVVSHQPIAPIRRRLSP